MFLLLITNRSQLTENLKINASQKNLSFKYSLGKARSERHYLIVSSSSIKQPRTMTSKFSRSVLSMKDYQAVLAEASTLEKPYSETGHLYPANELLPRPVWFKGSRDRCLRGHIAA